MKSPSTDYQRWRIFRVSGDSNDTLNIVTTADPKSAITIDQVLVLYWVVWFLTASPIYVLFLIGSISLLALKITCTK